MKILVTGSRHWSDEATIRTALSAYSSEGCVLIHGAAKGADSIAESVARELGMKTVAYPAQWNKYGKKAGTIRNRQMLNEGRPDLVLAFPLPDSIGTRHMIGIAKRAGVRTIIYEPMRLNELDDALDAAESRDS